MTSNPSSYDYATTEPPSETYPLGATRNNANGTDADVIERFKIREICEGWGNTRTQLLSHKLTDTLS